MGYYLSLVHPKKIKFLKEIKSSLIKLEQRQFEKWVLTEKIF
jgi:hypothetical protein